MMYIVDDIPGMLALLHYDVAWLEHDFLDAALLLEQAGVYRKGADRNTEHYRYAAFCRVLASRSEMNDAEIAHYVWLAQHDIDKQGMARSALLELLSWSGLTNIQFDFLAGHPAYAEPTFQKQVFRLRMREKLNNAPVMEETFEACLVSGDIVLQRELAAVRQLTQQQLQTLAERGSSRAVRNMAKVRIR